MKRLRISPGGASLFAILLNCSQALSQVQAISENSLNKGREMTVSPADDTLTTRMHHIGKMFHIDDVVLNYTLAWQDLSDSKLKKLDNEISFKRIDRLRDKYDARTNALLYDIIVRAKVIDLIFDSSDAACYRTTVIAKVEKEKHFEKRPANFSDTILTILRQSGPSRNGGFVSYDGYKHFEIGKEYLFLLTQSRVKWVHERGGCKFPYSKNIFYASDASPCFSDPDCLEYLEKMQPVLKIFREDI